MPGIGEVPELVLEGFSFQLMDSIILARRAYVIRVCDPTQLHQYDVTPKPILVLGVHLFIGRPLVNVDIEYYCAFSGASY